MSAQTKTSVEQPSARRWQLTPALLVSITALLLVAFGVAAWWSWRYSPRFEPTQETKASSWQLLTSAIEGNPAQRLPFARGNFNDAFALRGTTEVWVVGAGGLILHSADAGESWETQKVDWQGTRPQAPPRPAATAARNRRPLGFSLIAAAYAETGGNALAPAQIAEIQNALNTLGYQAGPADGYPGPRLVIAVREYQRANRLESDGLLTTELLGRLQKDVAANPGKQPANRARPVGPGNTSQKGSAQSGSTPSGPSQTGSAQSRSASSGQSQTGLVQSGSAPTSPSQTGSARSGSASGGPSQTGSAQSGSTPTSPSQTGSAQSRSAPTGASQTGSAQSGAASPVSAPIDPVDLAAIAFLDRSRGIAVGADGVTLTTNDGGANWSASKFNPSLQWCDVGFFDATHAVAVSREGAIAISDDFGANWKVRLSPGPPLATLAIGPGAIGLAAGAQGFTMSTIDRGLGWELASNRGSSRGDVDAIQFIDAERTVTLVGSEHAVLLGEFGSKATRSSGGSVVIKTPNALRSLAFVTADRGAVVGRNGTIALTANSGRDWKVVRSGSAADLSSIAFIDEQRAVAVGEGGTLLVSHDGGSTWWPRTRAASEELLAVNFTDRQHGVAVGRHGVVLRTTHGSARFEPVASGTTRDLRAVANGGDGRWLAVGAAGTGLLSIDDGVTWSQLQMGTTETLVSIQFVTPSRAIASGELGAVATSVDAGATWTTITAAQPHVAVRAAVFLDARRGIRGGDRPTANISGAAEFTRDGGANWRPIEQTRIGTLTSLAGTSNARVFGAGREGALAVTRDAGQSWTPLNSPTRQNLRGIDFVDSSNGLAVGANGTILLTRDGGNSWFVRHAAPEQSTRGPRDVANLNAVDFIDARNAVAVGEGGTILRSSDGGATWTPLVYTRAPAMWVGFFLFCIPAIVLLWQRTQPPPPPPQYSMADLLVSDRPLRAGEPDLLGFGQRAEQISRFLRHEQTDLPVTLAITAPWGRGKSSLMNLIEADLGAHGFRPVWFNAWHHEKEGNLLASLLQTVRQQALPQWTPRGILMRVRLLEKRSRLYLVAAAIPLILIVTLIAYFQSYPARLQAIVPNVKFALNINRPTLVTERTIQKLEKPAEGGTRVPEKWLALLKDFEKTGHKFNNPDELLAALRADPPAGAVPLSSELGETIVAAAEHIPPSQRVFPELGNVWTGFSAALAAFIAAVTVVLNGMSVFGLRAAKLKTGDEGEATGTRKRYGDDFKRLTEVMGRSLVVIIDDLDRCSRQSLLEVLEHINFLTSQGGCSIIVGVAYERVIERLAISLATEAGRKRDNGPLQEDLEEAESYLHKFIQLKVGIPQPAQVDSLKLFTAPGKRPALPQPGLRRAAQTTVKYSWPWVAILLLTAFGIWAGHSWIGEVYPQPTIDALAKELSDLNTRVPATDDAPTPGSSIAPPPDSGDGATPTPRGEVVKAELVPAGDTTFPYAAIVTEACFAMILIGAFMLWRDQELRERVFVRARRRLRALVAAPVRERDSEAFLEALRIWHPLIAARSPTPRDLKRALNRLRFEVMSVISFWPPGTEDREPQIAALAALYQLDPTLAPDLVAVLFVSEPDDERTKASSERLRALKLTPKTLLDAAQEHRARFGRGPTADEWRAYQRFVG